MKQGRSRPRIGSESRPPGCLPKVLALVGGKGSHRVSRTQIVKCPESAGDGEAEFEDALTLLVPIGQIATHEAGRLMRDRQPKT